MSSCSGLSTLVFSGEIIHPFYDSLPCLSLHVYIHCLVLTFHVPLFLQPLFLFPIRIIRFMDTIYNFTSSDSVLLLFFLFWEAGPLLAPPPLFLPSSSLIKYPSSFADQSIIHHPRPARDHKRRAKNHIVVEVDNK